MIKRLQRLLTGIEIGPFSMKMVQVLREKRGWRLLQCATIPFPEETLKLSYKSKNINDPEAFMEVLREMVGLRRNKFSRVGLSIPSEIVKVTLQNYKELPEKRDEIEKMIAWWSRKSIPFPVESARIAYHYVGLTPRKEKRLLVAVSFRDVIREYELNLREIKLRPEVIRPAGINQLNFYLDRIPPSGTVGFLGLLENFFTFFVFEDSHLIFYHGVRRGFSDIHFFQDLEMTIQLFLDETNEKRINKLYYASQAGFEGELEKGLKSFGGGMRIRKISEEEIISVDESLLAEKPDIDIGKYASAIGAAESLVE